MELPPEETLQRALTQARLTLRLRQAELAILQVEAQLMEARLTLQAKEAAQQPRLIQPAGPWTEPPAQTPPEDPWTEPPPQEPMEDRSPTPPDVAAQILGLSLQPSSSPSSAS